MMSPQQSFTESKRSFNQIERMNYSAIRGNRKRQDRFILQKDFTNKFKVNKILADTVQMPNSIPFLRDLRDVSNQTFSKINSE